MTSESDHLSNDVLSRERRHHVMSQIRGKDTRPEMLIRRGLHRLGLRYRIHQKTMPGTPDLVFTKYRVVVFVHGCFWHGHSCPLFKWPKTRASFWKTKINRNRERDREALMEIDKDGWRTLVIWECSLKGKNKKPLPEVLQAAASFITDSKESFAEIMGSEAVGDECRTVAKPRRDKY